MWDWIKSKLPGGGGGSRLLYLGPKTEGGDTAAKKSAVTFELELVLVAAGAAAVVLCFATSVWAFRWAKRRTHQLYLCSAYNVASGMESRADDAFLD